MQRVKWIVGLLVLGLALIPVSLSVQAQGGDDALINWCLGDGVWADGRCGDGTTWESQWYWTCGWYHAHVEQDLLAKNEIPAMCRFAEPAAVPPGIKSKSESGGVTFVAPYALVTCGVQITGGMVIGGGLPLGSSGATNITVHSVISPAAAGIPLWFELRVDDVGHPAYGSVRASGEVLTLADGTASFALGPGAFQVDPPPTAWLFRWSFVNPAQGTTTCESFLIVELPS